MTRKDHIRFAKMLSRLHTQLAMNHDRRILWKLFEKETADIFADDNPRFDRAKFYEACEKRKLK